MELLTATQLQNYCETHPREFQALLPELVKRLIICSQPSLNGIRIPTSDDIWAPGFDGIIECSNDSTYVGSGISVWEFGTNSNVLSKINDDYKKRTEDSLGIDKAEAMFYLVTPRIWAVQSISIKEWEQEKTDWKSVRVYDGVVLADWINSEPAVYAWLYEYLFRQPRPDFETVSSSWNHFSSKTNPPLSSLMFLDKRENGVQALYGLCSLDTIIRIKAETRIESYGFALAALREKADLRECCIVVNDSKSFSQLSSQLCGKVFLLNYPCTDDIITNGNTVIICFNKESTCIEGNINLNLLPKSHFLRAFKSMGFDYAEADALYTATCGNMRALIRKIPGCANEDRPDWANLGSLHLLIPIAFLRSFHPVRDRKLVEQLSGTSYMAIENKYNELLRLEDSPIKRVGDYYSIVDFESTFAILNIHTSDSAFDRLNAAVLSILNDAPDVYTMEGNRYADTIFHSLLLNYVFFSESDSENDKIADAVKSILDYAYLGKASQLVFRNLPFLAMAAPEAVFRFIQAGLEKGQKPLLAFFTEKLYSNICTNAINALEELTQYDETSVNACNTLFNLLICLKQESEAYNSVKGALLNTLFLAYNRGALVLSQKTALFKKYITQIPEIGLLLFTEALEQRSVYYGLYIGIKKVSEEAVPISEYLNAFQIISETAFSTAIANSKELVVGKILGNYSMFCPDFLCSLADRFSPDAFNDVALANLNFSIRKTIFRSKECNVEYFVKYEEIFPRWLEKTSSSDPVLSVAYLFHEYLWCPIDECLLEENPLEVRKIADEHRVQMLKLLVEQNGIEKVSRLVHFIDHSYQWGAIFAKALSSVDAVYLAGELVKAGKQNILYSFINCADKLTADLVFQSFPEDVQLQLLHGIARTDSYDWLGTPEREAAYWSHQQMDIGNQDEYRFLALLKYHPEGLLPYCYELSTTASETDVTKIMDIFFVILKRHEEPERGYCESGFINEIIKNVEKKYYSPEWAELCYMLFSRQLTSELSKAVCIYFFNAPDRLRSESSKKTQSSIDLKWKYQLPEQAYLDYTLFKNFFSTLIEDHDILSIHFAGEVLGRAKTDSDGISPHMFTRRVLEELHPSEIVDAVFSGKINSFGFREIHDGSDQKQMADEYKRKAKEYEVDYPITACFLKRMSDYYASTGHEDYLRSELGYL